MGIDGQVYADFNTESEDTVTESPTKIIIKCPAGASYASGEIIDISLDLSYLHVFDAETEESLAPRIPPAAFAECSFTEKLPPVKKKKTRKKGEKARETVPEVQPTEIERKIFVAVGGDFAAESVSLRPDISKVRVYDEERDIRLV